MFDKYQTNCERINDIANACEREQRERTEAETAEFNALKRENDLLQMRMHAAASEQLRENPANVDDVNRIVRENMAAGRQTQLVLMRDLIMVSDATTGGIVPVKINDVLDPLVVSIHAPTRGATVGQRLAHRRFGCFNPRTHTGCD